MYSMKEACVKTGMTYETLKYYCNEGLIPNIKRNSCNHRIFSEKNITWILGLSCLRDCGMSIQEMKEYLSLCLAGESTIPDRKEILEIKRNELIEKLGKIQKNIDYIDSKKKYYDDVLSGKIEFHSSLID